MICFSCRKPIVAMLGFILLMTLSILPLPAAKARRGATVVATMADGFEVKGELLAVKADALIINDLRGGERLDLLQVVQIKRLKKSSGLQGVVIGLGVGLGMSVLAFDQHNLGGNPLILGLSLPLIGGLMGGLVGENRPPEKFNFAGESLETVRQNLERLKRYAREQD